MLTDYTDYNTIRALLGVGRLELTDAALALPLYENLVVLGLEGLDGGTGTANTEYATIAAIAPSSRTANQARFYMLVGMWAAYIVAQELLATVPMFAPQQITDGKTQMQRVDDPFETQRQGVLSGYMDLRNRLMTLLLLLVPTATVTTPVDRVFISSTGTGFDPITG